MGDVGQVDVCVTQKCVLHSREPRKWLVGLNGRLWGGTAAAGQRLRCLGSDR